MQTNHASLIWHRLARIKKRYDRITHEKLNEYGLSEAVADILGRVYDSPGITQKRLSEQLLVTKGNIAQLVKNMEAWDLVFRKREGRTKHLYLTDKGLETYEHVIHFLNIWIDNFLDGLSKEEKKDLLNLLSKVDRTSKGLERK